MHYYFGTRMKAFARKEGGSAGSVLSPFSKLVLGYFFLGF
jgi:hypothetical protein